MSAGTQQTVTPGPLKVRLHQVRFAEDKLRQQIVQKIAAVAVWQGMGWGIRLPFDSPDKTLPDARLIGYGVCLRLRGAGKKYAAQGVVKLGGVKF